MIGLANNPQKTFTVKKSADECKQAVKFAFANRSRKSANRPDEYGEITGVYKCYYKSAGINPFDGDMAIVSIDEKDETTTTITVEIQKSVTGAMDDADVMIANSELNELLTNIERAFKHGTGDTLHDRMASLGTFHNISIAEIIGVCGEPDERCINEDGKIWAKWSDASFSIAMVFEANGMFNSVLEQNAVKSETVKNSENDTRKFIGIIAGVLAGVILLAFIL